jgi:hypothetical protein
MDPGFMLNFQKTGRKSAAGALFLCPLAGVDLSLFPSKKSGKGVFNDEE